MAAFRDVWVKGSLLLSVLVLAALLSSFVGVSGEWALREIELGGVPVSVGGLALYSSAFIAAIAVILAFFVPPPRGWRFAIVALLIPTVLIAYFWVNRPVSIEITPGPAGEAAP